MDQGPHLSCHGEAKDEAADTTEERDSRLPGLQRGSTDRHDASDNTVPNAQLQTYQHSAQERQKINIWSRKHLMLGSQGISKLHKYVHVVNKIWRRIIQSITG